MSKIRKPREKYSLEKCKSLKIKMLNNNRCYIILVPNVTMKIKKKRIKNNSMELHYKEEVNFTKRHHFILLLLLLIIITTWR